MRPLLAILSLLCGYGRETFKQPNLDRLADTGMKFERCYSVPLCGVLLTGGYPFRPDYLDNNTSAIDPKKHHHDGESVVSVWPSGAKRLTLDWSGI